MDGPRRGSQLDDREQEPGPRGQADEPERGRQQIHARRGLLRPRGVRPHPGQHGRDLRDDPPGAEGYDDGGEDRGPRHRRPHRRGRRESGRVRIRLRPRAQGFVTHGAEGGRRRKSQGRGGDLQRRVSVEVQGGGDGPTFHADPVDAGLRYPADELLEGRGGPLQR